MKNEKFMAIVVIGLIAVIGLQTFQIFANGQRTQTRTTGMMAGTGAEQFGSTEEMMEAHHGSGSQQFSSQEEMMAAHHGTGAAGVGGCGGH